MFYAFIQNNKIVGRGQCKCQGDNIICIEITEDIYNNIEHYIYNGTDVVINPNYDKEQKEKEEAEFNRKFFNTSLGYVSRDVHMKNGTVKDFLTDILPLLKEGIEIYTYTANKEQKTVTVTEQFIDECKRQVLVDFYGED